LNLCIGGISSGAGAMNVDWVRVRKYAPTVPTFSLGAESPLSLQTVSLGNDTSVCDISGGLLMDAGAGFSSYTWSGIASGSTQTATVNTVGQVIINAVDASSCPSTDTLLVSEFAPINLNIGVDQIICSGDTLTLDAGAGFANYTWSSGGTNQLELVSAVGNYIANVTDVNGCTDADTIDVSFYPQPTSSFTFSSTSLATTFSNTSTGGVSYFWDFGDGNTSTNFDTVHVFAVSGTYNVCLTATNSDNCETTTCNNVTVANTGINNDLTEAGIKIYPNPAKDFIFISSINSTEEMGIVITDMLGKMVYVKQPAIIQQTSIDVSSFAKGNYIVQISVANRHYYSSLIIAD
jgi:PKD repeat protein